MTIAQHGALGPISNVGISPFGSGAKGALINTGLAIVETVITNYLKNKFSGKALPEKTTNRKSKRTTFGNQSTYNRPRNRNYRRTYYKGFRSRAKVAGGRKRYYLARPKFRRGM